MLSTDPIDLLLDPSTGDLVVQADLALSSGLGAVVQAARIRMAMIAGEWFLDLDAGLPYFERDGVDASRAIFGQRFDQDKALRAFRDALEGTPGVVAIAQLDVAFDVRSRAMTVTWRATTSFGDTPIDTLALGT
jgi:hypothetical protein